MHGCMNACMRMHMVICVVTCMHGSTCIYIMQVCMHESMNACCICLLIFACLYAM